MASYPGSLPTFSTKADGVDVVDAADPNTIQAELYAALQIIGVNPHVSTTANPAGTFITASHTFSNLLGRLANIETGVVSDAHTQYVHKAGGDTVTAAPGTVPLTIRPPAGSGEKGMVVLDHFGTLALYTDQDGVLFKAGGIAFLSRNDLGSSAQSVALNGSGSPGTDTTVAREDHVHPVVIPLSQAFHFGTVTTGLKIVKWIPGQDCTLTFADAVLEAGTGAKFRVYVDGASPSGMADSGAVGNTVVTHNFTDVPVSAGQKVQINIVNAGTSASDLSVTVHGFWR